MIGYAVRPTVVGSLTDRTETCGDESCAVVLWRSSSLAGVDLGGVRQEG